MVIGKGSTIATLTTKELEQLLALAETWELSTNDVNRLFHSMEDGYSSDLQFVTGVHF